MDAGICEALSFKLYTSERALGIWDNSKSASLIISGNLAGWAVDRISVFPSSFSLIWSTASIATAVWGSIK